MEKRRGRPPKDDSRRKRIIARVDDELYDMLSDMVKSRGTNVTEEIKRAIRTQYFLHFLSDNK